MNSLGDGRGVCAGAAGAAAAPPDAGALGLGAGAGVAARGAGAGVAAVAAVVAGRFAQPVITSPASSSDIIMTWAARVSTLPPVASALNAGIRRLMLSRQARRASGTCRLRRARRE